MYSHQLFLLTHEVQLNLFSYQSFHVCLFNFLLFTLKFGGKYELSLREESRNKAS